jgi:adenylate kinase
MHEKDKYPYMQRGELVPDGLIVNLVEQRLRAPDCDRGYLLDGFPRTLAQAEAMKNAGVRVDYGTCSNRLAEDQSCLT